MPTGPGLLYKALHGLATNSTAKNGMASHLLLAQQIFSEIYKQANFDAGTGMGIGAPTDVRCVEVNGTFIPNIINATSNVKSLPNGIPFPAASANPSSSLPKDLPSLVLFFFSLSALREWLKLLVVGSALEMMRRLVFYVYRKIYESFFITAVFEENDTSYRSCFSFLILIDQVILINTTDWVCYWLSRQPTWRYARDVQVSTQSFGLDSVAVTIEGEDDSDPDSQGGRPLAYLPAQDVVHTMWYKRHWMRVTRFTKDGFYGHRDNFLEIRILTRKHDILNTLLLEAKKAHTKAQENSISVYVSDSTNAWRHIASRPKRPLNSIILDPGMKDLLIDDATDFLASKAWYASRGIPFRRGYLLYGAPGSGKTSMIHSLAGELGLDVYIVSLSRTGLDDTALSELISELPGKLRLYDYFDNTLMMTLIEKCIALMEDIDAAFGQTMNREAIGSAGNANDEDEEDENKKRQKGDPALHNGQGDFNQQQQQQINNMQGRPTSRITLSGLLNALDGVAAQEGRILFATTNKYDSLDPALCRPGRMDIHMEFKLASMHQARELFKCFYLPDKKERDRQKLNEKGGDCGDSPGTDKKTRLNLQKEGDLLSCRTSRAPDAPPGYAGSLHTNKVRTESLSIEKILAIADEFADCIPEREFSMASLQGYLMGYKVRPVDAVRDIREWVEKGRKEAEKKRKEK